MLQRLPLPSGFKMTRTLPRLPLLILAVILLLGALAARLVVEGQWYLALGLFIAPPGLILLHNHPYLGLIVWLTLTPFLLHTDSTTERQMYWIIHRGLPLLTLLLVIVSSALRIKPRPMPRFGLPEFAMFTYVVVSLMTIYIQNGDPLATVYRFYDRVISPMFLYLLIRITSPSEKELKWLLPVAMFITLTQSAIGLLSWAFPAVLPNDWLTKQGMRTVGSLVNTSVFSTTMTFTGLLMLHWAHNTRRRPVRLAGIGLFLLAFYMVAISFSRASWIAAILTLIATTALYPRVLLKLAAIGLPLVILVGAVVFSSQIEFARQRLESREAEVSALHRLPVLMAAVGMFEARPIFGWGYDNFNVYDRRFQVPVLDLVNTEKDHSSHNVYLTLLAEQGLVGFLLFMGPLFWWLKRSVRAFFQLPAGGFTGRKLLAILWLALLTLFVNNNFAPMWVVYGLGIWWVLLGLIANLTQQFQPAKDADGMRWVRQVTAERGR